MLFAKMHLIVALINVFSSCANDSAYSMSYSKLYNFNAFSITVCN